MKRFLFENYFYVESLIWSFCNLMPQFLRRLLFKLVFKRYGDGSTLDYSVYVRYPWKVSIGSGTTINRGCKFYTSYVVRDAEITIGDHVAIGPEVSFCSASHLHTDIELADIAATIRVENRCWVGAKSVILPGITIGEGAVVGAGSVVTKDVPPWTIVAGNPARFIKERTLT